MEIIIILALILLNGLLSMSEIALVSVRKSKLEAELKKGNNSVKTLFNLIDKPDHFLSMIQIGITLIGILTGMFSGESIADKLGEYLTRFNISPGVALNIAKTIIVVIVTYLTLILGELVPKIIGMNRSESIAKIVAKPIKLLSVIVSPIVWILSKSTNAVVKLLGIKNNENKVTEDEIKAIVNEGYNGGEVQEMERDIVERVVHLDDLSASSVMTHRNNLEWIDINDDLDRILTHTAKTMFSIYPICNGSLDNIIGVVYLKDLFRLNLENNLSLKSIIKPCNFIPENNSLYRVLESFNRQNVKYGIVIDEYGTINGIVTLKDIMEVLFTEVFEEDVNHHVIRRSDGTLLVDGQLAFYDFLNILDIEIDNEDMQYNTVGGLVLDILEHIPTETEKIHWKNYTIEVLDMDGARIDKLLVSKDKSDQTDSI